MSRQKTACSDIKWEEYNQSAETKKVYVVTKFSAESQHKEEIVATKKLLSLQIKHEEGINSVMTRYLLSRQKIKSNTGRILRYKSLCCDIMKNRRQNLCHDRILLCRDTIMATWKSLLR